MERSQVASYVNSLELKYCQMQIQTSWRICELSFPLTFTLKNCTLHLKVFQLSDEEMELDSCIVSYIDFSAFWLRSGVFLSG